ncbi:hypothetical protein MDA_GLEAN10002928 [Myotis davidii]|uniref:Uncharacterized protein n=1 Tax=Myotis davidii TaxID=225400 RepID=L5MKD8_MYODS|nr:hypothetical protein MDA_GLEAN10002928 [Myotis davidii]
MLKSTAIFMSKTVHPKAFEEAVEPSRCISDTEAEFSSKIRQRHTDIACTLCYEVGEVAAVPEAEFQNAHSAVGILPEVLVHWCLVCPLEIEPTKTTKEASPQFCPAFTTY